MKKDNSIDKLIENMKKTGVSEEEVERLVKLMKDIGMLAQDVHLDYTENPSELTGSVDTDKNLVRGAGIQIDEKIVPDEDTDEEWELLPKKKDK